MNWSSLLMIPACLMLAMIFIYTLLHFDSMWSRTACVTKQHTRSAFFVHPTRPLQLTTIPLHTDCSTHVESCYFLFFSFIGRLKFVVVKLFKAVRQKSNMKSESVSRCRHHDKNTWIVASSLLAHCYSGWNVWNVSHRTCSTSVEVAGH